MATKQEVLRELQYQIEERIDFLRKGLDKTDNPAINKLYRQKIDELLDQYNNIQRQIEEL